MISSSCRREVLQDVSSRIHNAPGRAIDTYSHAGELVGPQALDDRLHAILPASAAKWTQAKLACGQIQVVENDNEIGGFDFVEGQQRLNCFATEVHIGLRFDNEDTLLANPAAGDFGFVLAFVEGQVM